MIALNRQQSLRALSTVNEMTLRDDPTSSDPTPSISTEALSTEIPYNRASSLPVSADVIIDLKSTNNLHSLELKRTSSLSLRPSSSSPHNVDTEKSENFQNAHLVSSNLAASLKSSQKLNRQLSEALIPKTTLAYDETVPNDKTVTRRSKMYRLLKREVMLLLDTYSDQSGKLSNIRNGLSIVVIFGLALGLWMPKNDDLPTPWYRYVSSIIGYTYVVSWGVCFYPQLIINAMRNSVAGLSTDSALYQLVGLAAYATYCTAFYFNSSIKHEYQELHGKNSKVMVESSDVAFALHGTLMSAFLVSQIIYYGGFKMTPPSKVTKYILAFVFLWSAVYIILILRHLPGFLWIDFLYFLASIKVFLGIGSYLSQVLFNYHRRSTMGFNVWNIILDFTGGLLSLFQLIFDAVDMNDIRGIFENWAKLVVSLISLAFDHFYLYSEKRQKGKVKNQELRVLHSGNEENMIV